MVQILPLLRSHLQRAVRLGEPLGTLPQAEAVGAGTSARHQRRQQKTVGFCWRPLLGKIDRNKKIHREKHEKTRTQWIFHDELKLFRCLKEFETKKTCGYTNEVKWRLSWTHVHSIDMPRFYYTRVRIPFKTQCLWRVGYSMVKDFWDVEAPAKSRPLKISSILLCAVDQLRILPIVFNLVSISILYIFKPPQDHI